MHSSEIKTPREAWAVFSAKPAPRLIAAAFVLALAARVAVGDFSWRDIAAVAAMLVIYPFGEWAIHVYLLHSKLPLTTTRAHMEHHREPHRLDWVNFSPKEALAILLLAAPFAVALTALIVWPLPGPLPLGALVTELATAYVLIWVYEWVHFLIHTSHRPRSGWYYRVWRNHRLHHFKNERYWHGITNTISDTVLGTNPDQRDVERSRTARAIHGW